MIISLSSHDNTTMTTLRDKFQNLAIGDRCYKPEKFTTNKWKEISVSACHCGFEQYELGFTPSN